MALHRSAVPLHIVDQSHLTKQAFGVICSPTANSSYDGKLAYVAGWEDVLVWDVKLGEMVSSLLSLS
jgi:hypothetical protein